MFIMFSVCMRSSCPRAKRSKNMADVNVPSSETNSPTLSLCPVCTTSEPALHAIPTDLPDSQHGIPSPTHSHDCGVAPQTHRQTLIKTVHRHSEAHNQQSFQRPDQTHISNSPVRNVIGGHDPEISICLELPYSLFHPFDPPKPPPHPPPPPPEH